MSLIVQNFYATGKDDADRLRRIEKQLGLILEKLETIMATVADLEAALTAIDGKVATVKSDVDELLAKLAAIPTADMTPEQQAAIDGAVVHAQAILGSLGAIDAAVHPAA